MVAQEGLACEGSTVFLYLQNPVLGSKTWQTFKGACSRGHPATTFIDQLERHDSGLSRQDLASVMANRREWDIYKISAGAPK